MFTLHTLTEAFYMAKMQEQTLVALKSRYTPLLPTPSPKSNNNVAYGSRTNSVPVKPNTSYNKNPNRTRLTQKEYEEKRASNMKDNGENIMKSINEGPFIWEMVSDVIAGGTEGAVQQGPVVA
ncbi:hypothetical protein Tco_1270797 [Tanacetum coccineum]